MRKTKLIPLLFTLKKAEWTKLQDFLASPYYNKDETVIQLFQQLATKIQRSDSDLDISKEELAASLWPGKAYNAKEFTYVLSRLNKLVEQYIALEQINQSEFELQLAALDAFSERGLDKHFQASKRQLHKDLSNTKQSAFSVYKTRARLYEVEDLHYNRQRKRVYDPSIQLLGQHLDHAYFLQRLHQACSILDRQHILQADYDTAISEDWLRHISDNLADKEPIIQVYLDIFTMLQQENEVDHFATFKQHLFELQAVIADKDLTEIYFFAINYCARKIRAGQEAYVAEALQLYLQAIEAGWFIINEQLSPWTFANVVKLFLRQKEYDRAKTFIHKYISLLPAEFQENALHYNMAELHYYTNAYDEAQQHLVQVAFNDLNYYLGARVLLAKIYFQTGAEDALSSLLAAFMMFLQRNKQLSKNLKSTYLNFCRILARILRTTPEKRAAIRTKIEETSPLTDRVWLLSIL